MKARSSKLEVRNKRREMMEKLESVERFAALHASRDFVSLEFVSSFELCASSFSP
jgi:hypothetical protein